MDILLIDPSTSYRQVVKEILSSDDVIIQEATSGQSGLEYLKKNRPDAIAISFELSDMDSFQFLKKINKNSLLESIPKFLITSNVSQEFKRDAYEAGFTEIFFKTDFQTLKRALHSLLLSVTTRINAKILYVEDAQSTADYTRHIMHKVGWDVTHVKSGEEAADYLDKPEYVFDLVVTDLVLEGRISGIGLIDLIRHGEERIRHIPILAVSGWNDLLRQVYVLKHGAGDFIAKPFHENDFLARAINLIAYRRELKRLKDQQKALYRKANLDPVSGLNNRHYLEEYGIKFIEEALEEHQSVAMMLIDIDHFKQINDKCGHQTGDLVIKQISSIVKAKIEAQGFAVRFGGDEIMFLMTQIEQNEVAQRADELLQEVASLSPEGVSVSVSIGVAYSASVTKGRMKDQLSACPTEVSLQSEEALNYKVLFQVADEALYTAKEKGRNRAIFLDASRDKTQE